MKKLILSVLLGLFFTASLFGQTESEKILLGFYNSAIDDIAEQNPDYNILRDVNVNVIKDSDGKIITVRKVSQYAGLMNFEQFQNYVNKKRNYNEKIIDDSRLLVCVLQRKRTNLL